MADLNEGIVEQYAEHLLQKAASAVVDASRSSGSSSAPLLGAAPGFLSHSLISPAAPTTSPSSSARSPAASSAARSASSAPSGCASRPRWRCTSSRSKAGSSPAPAAPAGRGPPLRRRARRVHLAPAPVAAPCSGSGRGARSVADRARRDRRARADRRAAAPLRRVAPVSAAPAPAPLVLLAPAPPASSPRSSSGRRRAGPRLSGSPIAAVPAVPRLVEPSAPSLPPLSRRRSVLGGSSVSSAPRSDATYSRSASGPSSATCTAREPTTMPSASSAAARACSGVEMPKPA